MIIPDLNLLLYAYDTASANHEAAVSWWESSLNGAEAVGLPPVVIFGFLRLATSRRVFSVPMTIDEAADCVQAWKARPQVVEVDGGADYVSRVIELIRHAGTQGNLVTDAQIAAIAIEHAAVVCTNDSDFRRFPGLRTTNPLSAGKS